MAGDLGPLGREEEGAGVAPSSGCFSGNKCGEANGNGPSPDLRLLRQRRDRGDGSWPGRLWLEEQRQRSAVRNRRPVQGEKQRPARRDRGRRWPASWDDYDGRKNECRSGVNVELLLRQQVRWANGNAPSPDLRLLQQCKPTSDSEAEVDEVGAWGAGEREE
ncbi:unnamed protein product [Linum trigynum]|uniref:Uncharacterized protein n=1 Tax=Linum trigynum TaxID=586398 RepID=A0AAV2CS31_9ROSI